MIATTIRPLKYWSRKTAKNPTYNAFYASKLQDYVEEGLLFQNISKSKNYPCWPWSPISSHNTKLGHATFCWFCDAGSHLQEHYNICPTWPMERGTYRPSPAPEWLKRDVVYISVNIGASSHWLKIALFKNTISQQRISFQLIMNCYVIHIVRFFTASHYWPDFSHVDATIDIFIRVMSIE